jgi:inhibitor of KinA
MVGYRLLPAGDTAVVVEFGDTIDRHVNALILALDNRLKGEHWISETVPTFRSLMVHYDPDAISQAAIAERIAWHAAQIQIVERPSRLWRLPVCYDAELAPDLTEVVARTGLTTQQIIERHSSVVYHVYMLGFLPGLAYMGEVPPELAVPRLQSPRLRAPAGSLGIAMTMSLIMPRETASGLNLIGCSPVSMWHDDNRALLQPGDKVIHEPISLEEFFILRTRLGQGEIRVNPVTELREIRA